MKLSDLIISGSITVKLDPKLWLKENCGCLLGMALKAIGYTYAGSQGLIRDGEIEPWSTIPFPWLEKGFEVPKDLSSYIGLHYNHSVEKVDGLIILSYFSSALENKAVTFDQAIDWVRSVEPNEEVQINQEG